MPYSPLLKPKPLPTPGQDIERPVMDWKVKASAHPFEKAKDVAAFANHFGGTLLIGASEQNGQLAAYVGMAPDEANRVRDEFSKAVADRCKPPPAISFEEYEDPNDAAKRIVAVNVDPSLNLVGVRIAADKTKDGWGGNAYVFPVRSGTDSIFLEPGQLAMFMTPEVRRVAVMLGRIPAGALVNIVRTDQVVGGPEGMQFAGVFEEENLAKFTRGTETALNIPLDRVESVYLDRDGRWILLVNRWR